MHSSIFYVHINGNQCNSQSTFTKIMNVENCNPYLYTYFFLHFIWCNYFYYELIWIVKCLISACNFRISAIGFPYWMNCKLSQVEKKNMNQLYYHRIFEMNSYIHMIIIMLMTKFVTSFSFVYYFNGSSFLLCHLILFKLFAGKKNIRVKLVWTCS